MNQKESLINALINSPKALFLINSLNLFFLEAFIEFKAFFFIFSMSTGISRDKFFGSYGLGCFSKKVSLLFLSFSSFFSSLFFFSSFSFFSSFNFFSSFIFLLSKGFLVFMNSLKSPFFEENFLILLKKSLSNPELI